MKEIITVLIADDNREFSNLLSECMDMYDDIHVCGVALDGIQAVEMIIANTPDVVILDIIMPRLDGIGVLEKISILNLEHKPIFIVLSAIGQEMFIRKVILLGAAYYIVKPFDMDVLVSRIRQFYSDQFPVSLSAEKNIEFPLMREQTVPLCDKNSPEMKITGLLRDAGIPAHLPGYRYLRESIILAAAGKMKTGHLTTKSIYTSVAEKFGATPSKVERAIRTAIERGWMKTNRNKPSNIQDHSVYHKDKKPSNAEFIALIVGNIKKTKGSH